MINKNLSPQSIQKGIIIAWGELFLKSRGVKILLKRKLLNQLEFFLKKAGVSFKVISLRERIFIQTATPNKALKVLRRIFGLAWFARAVFLPDYSLDNLCNFVAENYQGWIKPGKSFALRIKHSPDLKVSSQVVIKTVAESIKRKVNLDKPQREIFIEGRKLGWFLYFQKEKGLRGLPAGSEGKVLSLVSGGIDSPVSSWLIAKRGAENVWLHFHSFPLVSRKSIDKIIQLSKIFLNYQPKLKVYFFPFSDIQMEIKTQAPAKYRILLYRRWMIKIAQKIARRDDCKALVTGESLGQVSSQTLSNIRVISEAAKLPILRPLVARDKQEIISLARQIGAYDISIKPQEDCCTLFMPKHPTAEGKIEEVKYWEKKLAKESELPNLVRKAFKNLEVKIFP